MYGKKGVNILKNIPNKILDVGALASIPYDKNGYVPKIADDEKTLDIYKSFRYR